MKVGDFNKFKQYFEENPEAQEAPDTLLEEEKPMEGQMTIEDLHKEIAALANSLETLSKLGKRQEPNKDIEELKQEVADLKAEKQAQAQKDSELPPEQTADDILKSFLTGGK